ncbi:hypothetical protein BRUM_1899 [Bifidobacterium ruminantium]|uniref:Uncharacterized protein n=1 Tax=Bifidobacterium ruminantium TaxID=78346 RepID=A0A087D3Q1_BIFRU|nr:hypothetical protein BRUM_1899 [Bifidobacterium ruminantium]
MTPVRYSEDTERRSATSWTMESTVSGGGGSAARKRPGWPPERHHSPASGTRMTPPPQAGIHVRDTSGKKKRGINKKGLPGTRMGFGRKVKKTGGI